MRQIDDLLSAFEAYYTTSQQPLRYTKMAREMISRKFGWIGQGFKGVLFDAVTSVHPTSLRSLPDIAVIQKAVAGFDNPQIYEAPKNLPQIEDKTEVVIDQVQSEIRKLAAHQGTRDPEGVQRIQDKARRGDASNDQLWWLKIQLDGGNTAGWKPMPADWDGRAWAKEALA